MKLSTIRRKKKQLIGNNWSWIALSGSDRAKYQALCKKERIVLLKSIQLPEREVQTHGNSTMDTR